MNMSNSDNRKTGLRLHLGCGDKIIDGFINIDNRKELVGVTVDDISTLSSIENETVSLIYACHILEHFPRHEYESVLKRWYEVLNANGVLRMSVPDFEKIYEYYGETKNLKDLLGLLYGGQDYRTNFHHCAWDFKTLKSDLISIGFKSISKYDWRETDHSHIDDFSQAYLPHLDKENGKLMSLNIEAKK
jgi:hypothetical protein